MMHYKLIVFGLAHIKLEHMADGLRALEKLECVLRTLESAPSMANAE